MFGHIPGTSLPEVCFAAGRLTPPGLDCFYLDRTDSILPGNTLGQRYYKAAVAFSFSIIGVGAIASLLSPMGILASDSTPDL